MLCEEKQDRSNEDMRWKNGTYLKYFGAKLLKKLESRREEPGQYLPRSITGRRPLQAGEISNATGPQLPGFNQTPAKILLVLQSHAS